MRDPFALCQTLLTLVVKGFADAEIALPPTQYVGPGQLTAYDGEQVTVSLSRIYGGQPATETPVQMPQLSIRSCELVVVVLRNTPVVDDSGNPPAVVDIENSAQQNMQDVSTLRLILENIRRDNLLMDAGGNTPFLIGNVSTYGPEGGLVGAVASIQIPLG